MLKNLSLKNDPEYQIQFINELILDIRNLDISKGRTIIGNSNWDKLNGYKMIFSPTKGEIYGQCEIQIDLCILNKDSSSIYYKSERFTQYSQIAWLLFNIIHT